jgi:hypothetical protein
VCGWQLALPHPPGTKVASPNGRGVVSAVSETPADWRMRVQLDGGGHWVGLASMLTPVYEDPAHELPAPGGSQA